MLLASMFFDVADFTAFVFVGFFDISISSKSKEAHSGPLGWCAALILNSNRLPFSVVSRLAA